LRAIKLQDRISRACRRKKKITARAQDLKKLAEKYQNRGEPRLGEIEQIFIKKKAIRPVFNKFSGSGGG